ncbi:IclR family transcriptional regulator [Prauserella cavernicola]|uniref:Helix-turn-helix domain-containing protein n=1 Tax=Prauserella cavernicola TaxID=2800127 RepID=A0A934V495_9PSEU|nr:helix-turn-helix domain-containing protein [Prauserella cavernicola]MBK1783880.1 helix-turn-helix domain-containing protein [Prauserella cavernicola]
MDIQAVDRVGKILALFGPHRESVSSSEAAELIGLNRTTTYRYLSSLVAANVLELRPDRSYGPGPSLIQLGAFALGRREILQLAAEPMAQLARETSVTTVLSLWGGSAPVVAHVEEPAGREIVVTVRVGMQLSPLAAQTKVFHAFHRDDSRVRRAARSLQPEDRAAFESELATTRQQGFATQTSPRGIAVIAAPVHDSSGMVASLALLSTREVLDLSDDSAERRALMETAATISTSMGHA